MIKKNYPIELKLVCLFNYDSLKSAATKSDLLISRLKFTLRHLFF